MKISNEYQSFLKISDKKIDNYKGLFIRADKNLHFQIANELSRLLPKGSRVLDFGCGQGALSLRLRDLGYNMIACDQNVQDFKAVNEIPFQPLNFNSPAEMDKFLKENHEAFDAVIGIEVIEHVENPWAYIDNLKSLVKKDGFIFVSTPNVSSWYARMIFLFTGTFPSFIDPDLMGHINPITPWELNVIGKRLNLKLEKMIAGGELPVLWINSSIPKTLLSFLFLPLYPFAKGLKLGWCTIAIFKK